MRSICPRSITCTGVEPSKAGFGCFSHCPTSFGFINRASASSKRSTSAKARFAGADGSFQEYLHAKLLRLLINILLLLWLPKTDFAFACLVLREIHHVDSILHAHGSCQQSPALAENAARPSACVKLSKPCSCTLRQSSRRSSSSVTSSAFSVSNAVRSRTRQREISAAITRRGSRNGYGSLA
jgi:hypothetical protein